MTYNECLVELDLAGVKKEFEQDFNASGKSGLIERIKNTDQIKSTAALIRTLMSFYEYRSEKWEYWGEVLVYFLTPDFERKPLK